VKNRVKRQIIKVLDEIEETEIPLSIEQHKVTEFLINQDSDEKMQADDIQELIKILDDLKEVMASSSAKFLSGSLIICGISVVISLSFLF
jgi:endo-1,4-beta-mannosidase